MHEFLERGKTGLAQLLKSCNCTGTESAIICNICGHFLGSRCAWRRAHGVHYVLQLGMLKSLKKLKSTHRFSQSTYMWVGHC